MIMIQSDFYCTQCGKKNISIMRPKSQLRENGHLKKLFCHTCKKETNNVECNYERGYTYEDFLKEFEHHNFDENGKRKISCRLFRGMMKNGQS